MDNIPETILFVDEERGLTHGMINLSPEQFAKLREYVFNVFPDLRKG